MAVHDLVLEKFRAGIQGLFGQRLERVVLYGSRARGDAAPDSDYDVAIFIDDLRDRWLESGPVADIQSAILDETGAVINAMLYPGGHWRHPSSPLMHEIRKDGLDL